MKEWLSVALEWTHLVATVVWAGGMVFILQVAIPAARKTLAQKTGGNRPWQSLNSLKSIWGSVTSGR